MASRVDILDDGSVLYQVKWEKGERVGSGAVVIGGRS